MKIISHQHKKELYNVEVKKEKQNESNEPSINAMLSRYSIWFMKNIWMIFKCFGNFRINNSKLVIVLYEANYVKLKS